MNKVKLFVLVLTILLILLGVIAEDTQDFCIAYVVILLSILVISFIVDGFGVALYKIRLDYNVWYIPFNAIMLAIVGNLAYTNVNLSDNIITVTLTGLFLVDMAQSIGMVVSKHNR